MLDVEIVGSLVAPIPVTFYYSSGGQFSAWANSVTNTPNSPWVHSVSWGGNELSNSQSFLTAFNNQLMKIASRGITIVFSAGDDGAWGISQVQGHFDPEFPATSPWVLAVGGTELIGTPHIGATETCSPNTGGGFSDFFNRTSWQASAVNKYLTTYAASLPTPHSLFNANGRGIPDVSALFWSNGTTGAGAYCVFREGFVTPTGGTSAAAPLVASMITLLNDIRFKNGKPSLGFVNPFLYQAAVNHPSSFVDVKSGVNNFSENPSQFPKKGFAGHPGWDACSGLGAPNFAVLRTLV